MRRRPDMRQVETDVRHPVYEASDKVGALRSVFDQEPAMVGDTELERLRGELQAAFERVFGHLQKHYLWD